VVSTQYHPYSIPFSLKRNHTKIKRADRIRDRRTQITNAQFDSLCEIHKTAIQESFHLLKKIPQSKTNALH